MQRSVRRAAVFAVVGTLALAAPAIGVLIAVPFALIAVAGRVLSAGPGIDPVTRTNGRREEEFRGLIGFALAATALALLTSLASLPVAVFVAAVLLVAYGNLVERVACRRSATPIRRAAAFTLGGIPAAIGGQGAVAAMNGASFAGTTVAFLAVGGALVGALLRGALVDRDDPLVVISVAFALWVFAALGVETSAVGLALALGIAGSVGYLSWLLGTASVTGMLAGVIIGLLTILLGGYGWFAVLIAFFGLGGLAAKFHYEEKREYGVAESNDGARGSRNVLGNAAVSLAAVVGFAASPQLPIDGTLFLFAFAGSVATALADTLSSEIGVLFGRPRLVTTLEPVPPGTDGGVTFRGALVGGVGAGVVAGLSYGLLDVDPAGAAAILLAGTGGMFVDSLLGATVEGRWIGNQAVNFLATLAGALIGAAGAVGFGLA